MRRHLRRAAVLACYQIVLLAGIAMMPLALAAGRLGLRLPLGEAVDSLGRAYDRAAGRP